MDNNQQAVVACIDGSTLTEAVCDYAAWIAQRVDAPLKLLHTIDHHHEHAATTDLSGNIGLGSQDHLLEEITNQEQQHSKVLMQQGKDMLNAAKEYVIKAGIADPIVNQRHGGLVESLIELEDKIRVLIIGARGKIHENKSDQIGAKLEPIIRSLHRPILAVNGAFNTPQRIMLAYDGSDVSEKAVDMVASSPLYKGLACHLVCLNKNKGKADALLEMAADKLLTAGGIEIIPSKLKGKSEHELCEYQQSNNIDLTVMGAFSHTRIHDLLLGSFTLKMLIKTKKPLLLLR